MATQNKSARRTSRKPSNQFPWGWIAAVVLGVLLFASWANNITRVNVGTVQGDLAAMQAQLTAQAAKTEAPKATDEPAPAPTIAPTVMIPTQQVPPTQIVVIPTNGVTIQVTDDGYRKFRPNASWIGDDFNVEETTPAIVHGPANLEIEPHMGFSCALIRVNEGESLKVIGGGAFWEAGSTGALTAMWEHHKAKYLSNYPECAPYVYDSVAAFLAANPTYLNLK